MSLSIQKMVSDGTLSTIVLGVQYLQRNDMYMRIAGVETPQSGAPSGYTWSFLDNSTIRVLPVVPAGVEVVVYRRTDLDEMYNIYSQNAQFDESTIDENNQQLLYIAQEYFEQGVPAQLIESVEYVREDTTNMYYRLKLSDGKYTTEFPVPKGGAAGFEALRRTYADAGLLLVDGSFEAGGTLTSSTDVLLHSVTAKAYAWSGMFPHIVDTGTDPTAVGSGYVPRMDVVLRDELSSAYGSSLIGSATYAQIRAYDGGAIKIKCIGRTNVFNESHGDFYLDVTDTATPDDDGTVLVDALGRRWKRRVQNHVLIEWFGDVTTDATLAIKASVGYCKAHDIKKIYALPRVYKITSSIVIDGHLDIDATSGATFVNAVADGPAFMIGTDPTIWNGFAARIDRARIIGDTTVTQSSGCHGIEIKAMRAEIRNCAFSNLKGSGIKGTFSQYSHIEKCAFDNCGRYGIEVYSPDWNLYMSGDMVIRDNYQLTNGLKLGGMYLEIGNSLVERNTFTDLSNCLTVKGWGNEIVKNTFETQPAMLDAVGKQITVIPYAGMTNVLRNNTLMGAHTGIVPITIDSSGSGKTVIDSCEFMESPKAGTPYVVNSGSFPVVFTGENTFADTTASVVNGSSSEWLQTYRKKVDNLSTTGAGPFYFASTFKLPCNGTWEITVTSGGNGNDYVNHRGSRVFLVHAYGNQYTFEYLTASKVVGGATIVDISSVSSSGIVVTCGNNLNGVGSITFSARHLCAE